jgi:hypothetical protein
MYRLAALTWNVRLERDFLAACLQLHFPEGFLGPLEAPRACASAAHRNLSFHGTSTAPAEIFVWKEHLVKSRLVSKLSKVILLHRNNFTGVALAAWSSGIVSVYHLGSRDRIPPGSNPTTFKSIATSPAL